MAVILAELTLIDGFVPNKKVADKIEYPNEKLKQILKKMHSEQKILRYNGDDDLWAVSVATRERLGITKKPIEPDVKK